jgi:hypothetical protein
LVSDPPIRESRMIRGWAHGFRSSTKGKKDDMRLGPWPQILFAMGKKDVTRLGPWPQFLPAKEKKDVTTYEAGPMASDPPLRERRMIRGYAHDLRSSTLRERRMF